MSYKDESFVKNNRYVFLWVGAFLLMLAYHLSFDNTEEVSESTGVMVALPYVMIAAAAAVVQKMKWLGTKR